MLVKQWGWIGGGEVSDVCVDGREKGRKEGGGSLYLIAAHAGHWDKFQTKIELACCVARSKAQAGDVANPTRVPGHPHRNRTNTV